jgi:hypothetical protein
MNDPQTTVPNSRPSFYQVLSLDVVLGAVCVGIFGIRILGARPHLIWWIILPLTVWAVYSFDHLVDGFKKKGNSTIYRHKFHYRKRKVLVPLVFISGLTAAVLSFVFLNRQIIIYGLGLSIFVLFYFILVSFHDRLKIRYIQKEFFIMFVYISGILLAPVIWADKPLNTGHYFIFTVLAALAWSESVMISFYDFSKDETDHLKSFTTVYGKRNTQNTITVLLFLLIFLLVAGLFFFSRGIILFGLIIELMMASTLLALVRFPGFFSKNGLFRWFGEAVFLLPALILLY